MNRLMEEEENFFSAQQRIMGGVRSEQAADAGGSPASPAKFQPYTIKQVERSSLSICA